MQLISRNWQFAGDLNPALVRFALAGLALFIVGLYLIPHRNTYSALVEAVLLLPGLALVLNRSGRSILGQMWRHMLPLWIFLLYTLVRILTDYGFEHSRYFTYVIEPAIFVSTLVVLVVADRERFERVLFWSLSATAFLGALQSVYWYALFQFPLSELLIAAGIKDTLEPLVQLSGFRNPLEVGMMVVIGYCLLLGFLLREPQSRHLRCIAWLGVMALLVFVALLQRRTGYVTVFGASLLALYMVRGHVAGIVFALVVAAGCMLWLLFPEAYTNRGLSHRPEEWLSALQGSLERPVLGHGFGENVLTYLDSGIVGLHAHNMHLGTLYSLGLAGLLCWMWIWLPEAVKSLFSGVSRDRLIYVLPLFAGMVYGCFDLGKVFSQINERWFITWLPVALLLGHRALDTVVVGAANYDQSRPIAGGDRAGVV